jgi:ribosomal protein S18 acetylase RimI-like enzyme
MQHITFRKLAQKDIDEAAKLIYDMHMMHLEEAGDFFDATFLKNIDLREKLKKFLANPEACVFIAECDGKIVGTASVEILKNEEKIYPFDKFGFYDDLTVDPDYRGRGMSHKLYELRAEFVKSKGVKVCKGEVYAFNVPVQGLLQKHGFQEVFKTYFKFLD